MVGWINDIIKLNLKKEKKNVFLEYKDIGTCMTHLSQYKALWMVLPMYFLLSCVWKTLGYTYLLYGITICFFYYSKFWLQNSNRSIERVNFTIERIDIYVYLVSNSHTLNNI